MVTGSIILSSPPISFSIIDLRIVIHTREWLDDSTVGFFWWPSSLHCVLLACGPSFHLHSHLITFFTACGLLFTQSLHRMRITVCTVTALHANRFYLQPVETNIYIHTHSYTHAYIHRALRSLYIDTAPAYCPES